VHSPLYALSAAAVAVAILAGGYLHLSGGDTPSVAAPPLGEGTTADETVSDTSDGIDPDSTAGETTDETDDTVSVDETTTADDTGDVTYPVFDDTDDTYYYDSIYDPVNRPASALIKDGEFTVPATARGIGSVTRIYGNGHKGIDINAREGTPVRAAADGEVIMAKHYYGSYGHTVIIRHDNGLITLYAHCSELLVEEGDTVKAGDEIAKVGSTGRSVGPHLHFEVIDTCGNRRLNPTDYLPE
jgi:murein DD-endopeptidase MepM/ murein hydrolase activator NlpD